MLALPVDMGRRRVKRQRVSSKIAATLASALAIVLIGGPAAAATLPESLVVTGVVVTGKAKFDKDGRIERQTLTNDKRVPAARVDLFWWPDAGDLGVKREMVRIGSTETDSKGSYALRGRPTAAAVGIAAKRQGWLNLLMVTTTKEGEQKIEGFSRHWNGQGWSSFKAKPEASASVARETHFATDQKSGKKRFLSGSPAKADLLASSIIYVPMVYTVEWVNVLEYHGDTSVKTTWRYGTTAESEIEFGIKGEGTGWEVGGTSHISNSRETHEGQTDLTDRIGAYVQSQFKFVHGKIFISGIDSGMTYVRAEEWLGGQRYGADVTEFDCDDAPQSNYTAPYLQDGYFSTQTAKAVTFNGGVDLGPRGINIGLKASSGYSQYVRVEYKFQAAGVVCGSDNFPQNAKIVYVNASENTLMVVGDSISQGLEGDYTWRYRLKQHFDTSGLSTNFVGPYRGTTKLPPAQPAGFPDETAAPSFNGTYRDGRSFDSDHFAQWGRQAHQAMGDVKFRVTEQKPKYLLVELGFNDLGWGVSSPDGLIADMRTLVANARAAKPDIRILIANVVHRTPISIQPDLNAKIDSYNSKLGPAVGSMNTTSSPVRLVDISTGYDPARDAYDGLHPNGVGEYKIARAFGNVLSSQFGLGRTFGSIPSSVPGLQLEQPASMTATSTDAGIKLSWSHVYGASGYWLYQRDADIAGSQFERSALQIPAYSWLLSWVIPGKKYQFYVVPTRGDSIGPQSSIAQATANPKTASGPTGIRAIPGSGYVDVSWQASTGAYSDTVSGYRVFFLDDDVPDAVLDSEFTSGRQIRLPSLINGHRYSVVISAVNSAGEGYPSVGPAVIPGAGVPGPTNLRSARMTSSWDVKLTWDAVPGAASYVVMVRNVRTSLPGAYTRYDAVSGTSTNIGWLFDGADLMEWCVVARNGSYESSGSSCRMSELGAPVLTAAQMVSPTDVQLSWEAVPGASRYFVMNRDVVAGGSWNRYAEPVEGTTKQIGWLFDGASRFEWCIVAATANIESVRSNCMRSHS
ncbi:MULTISPECIES: GDSL-type esterase/lipase family protein [unclassified Micromonospora]|uniref:GDSL-type esterase/lipase family protein n=1 Tax=unclassified Micromonospora TaxID=2617518 RepID=UPI001B370D8D|nr:MULTISPECIES: GDSL-type esterase/lipase family protein [unclassified Micromonospora]MBQ1041603.1 fibronectin type III domain-containing protein [Micromonospora sp. C72]MBQ1053352.1 fibronectin type III domain-containing protein [Micromonospora sp. C32]